MEKTAQRFEALSRICLNNWHYIDKRILSFHEGINFFTGHSGSGKSTVIDALQILLYANTDGRGFFNKAAADDSDRSLLEYLRGMVSIGENNEYSYLRNKNFSTTIVMELRRTDTGRCQSIGVIFDVETATNEINRLFFWHEGPFLENGYRTAGRAMATAELKAHLQQHYKKEQYYFGSSNERFRKQLYDVYLGGLNEQRFPQLFKRAIPFRMNIKLEDFVKEYICMEEDIQIEDMRESVMQYGRMRKKIGDTCEEISELKEIREAYDRVEEKRTAQEQERYFAGALEMQLLKEQIAKLQTQIDQYGQDVQVQQQEKEKLEQDMDGLEERTRELERQIADSGYETLRTQLGVLNDQIEQLRRSKGKWEQTVKALKGWEEQDVTPNPVLWDIERFEAADISEEELLRLKSALAELQKEVREQKHDLDAQVKQCNRKRQKIQEQLEILKKGQKPYPKNLEAARKYILKGLQDRTGKQVQVEILADLLEVEDDTWRNAVEGYMGNNKLLLVVEPAYVREAMRLYEELDAESYYSVSVLDTEKVAANTHTVREGALAEEVKSQRPYVQAYVDFLMGNVIKCAGIDELRNQKIGVTSDCMLYQGYKLQRMNPDSYGKYASIGKAGIKRRIQQLQKELKQLSDELQPLYEQQAECEGILALEILPYPAEEYRSWEQDLQALPLRLREQKQLTEKLEQLKKQDIDAWRQEQQELFALSRRKREQRDLLMQGIGKTNNKIEETKAFYLQQNEILIQKENAFVRNQELEQLLATRRQESRKGTKALQEACLAKERALMEKTEEQESLLREIRFQYLKKHPGRPFSAERKDNEEFDALLDRLQYTELESFYEKANEQAEEAILLFKNDFVQKIRSAIRNALERKDELNAIIDKLNFGKDRYRFKIGKNKGPDGKYYDMFMADDLEINPASLKNSMENQMDLFSMEHENRYGEYMNELISIFIPPDHASAEELEEAGRNMRKYADYRTYLSFDMEQMIQGQDMMKIPLSKMLKKNSGGEGQNPLYVALLASFAQAYRIHLNARLHRNPTIRLVVLDEAFSKMDAEKVASCIQLIRGFGFQAIISATNDKIQNYLESVDKTFVFANPNKKQISIQEFERTEFKELTQQ